MDQVYTPSLADFHILSARVLGFSMKVRPLGGGDPIQYWTFPGEMGFYSDTTSCEEAIFTTPNPFTAMTFDIFTGVTASQTQTIELQTVWGDCAYTYSVSPAVAWLSHSVSAAN